MLNQPRLWTSLHINKDAHALRLCEAFKNRLQGRPLRTLSVNVNSLQAMHVIDEFVKTCTPTLREFILRIEPSHSSPFLEKARDTLLVVGPSLSALRLRTGGEIDLGTTVPDLLHLFPRLEVLDVQSDHTHTGIADARPLCSWMAPEEKSDRHACLQQLFVSAGRLSSRGSRDDAVLQVAQLTHLATGDPNHQFALPDLQQCERLKVLHLRCLQEVALVRNTDLTLPSLEDLTIRAVGPAAVTWLQRLSVPKLQRLALTSGQCIVPLTTLQDMSIRSPLVEELQLVTDFEDAELVEVAQFWPNISSFGLVGYSHEGDFLRTIERQGLWPKLKQLDLSQSPILRAGSVVALVRSRLCSDELLREPTYAAIEELKLLHCQNIDRDALPWLRSSVANFQHRFVDPNAHKRRAQVTHRIRPVGALSL